MNFTSPIYLAFFPLVLFAHRRTPPRGRWAVLLGASWLFYAAWEPRYLLLILGTTLVSWLAALGMEGASPWGRRVLVALPVAGALGTLFLFKYADFFLGAGLGLLLPVGISFYTFQTLSYVLDVYRGDCPAERHFGYYALFVAFFPQLVAGPIERPGDLLPQLRAARDPSKQERWQGLCLLIGGYAKKVLIADRLAPLVDRVYAAPAEAEGLAVVVATALFGLQIYCDFSGYSEIAQGSARLLGVGLSRNFDRPYTAATLRDFWRRWHISLTRWFRDYLYIPLGGNRRGRGRQRLATLLVFAASGLWHGANWTFLLWGLWHGLWLGIEGLLPRRERRGLTLGVVFGGWLLFRAPSLQAVGELLGRVFSPWQVAAAGRCLGLERGSLLALPVLLALLALVDNRREGEPGPVSAGVNALLLLAIALGWLMGLQNGADSAFMYFQF